MQNIKLEVISTSPLDSITIQKAGADRIQLVSALQIGGLTPSACVIRKSIECVDIPTMVMVRHHNNGFVHEMPQVELLVEEARMCVEMGVKGVVFGGITKDRQIDSVMIQKISSAINLNKVDITFHKAFDQVSDIVESYEKLNQLKVPRVLTQGGTKPIGQNLEHLRQIITKSKTESDNTQVLVGGGVSFDNVKEIIKETSATQMHIGTCVRRNKYGCVELQRLTQFITLIR